MSVESLLAIVGGLGGAISVIITSLRKRQDISIEEMQRRISSLEDRVKHLEQENNMLQNDIVIKNRHIFNYKKALAENGHEDPNIGVGT